MRGMCSRACERASEAIIMPRGEEALKESEIEKRLVRKVRECGGLCYKFISPANPGVPDRIVVTPDGRTIYIELKTEIGRLANIQRWQIEQLRERGADVRVLKGLPEVEAFIGEVFGSAKT